MLSRISSWWMSIVALVVVLTVNGLANGLPLNGQQTGEISDKYPALFVPAGYVFSIWGLIYLGLIGFVVYQSLPSVRDRADLAPARQYFVISCLANSAWIFLWHWELIGLTVAAMLVLLASLIQVYRHLEKAAGSGAAATWLLRAPFSVYLGWITVATIANLTAWQTANDLSAAGLSAEWWTLGKLALAAAIGAAMVLNRGDKLFPLVVAWAAIGIYVKQFETAFVAGAAALVALIMVALVAGRLVSQVRDRAALIG